MTIESQDLPAGTNLVGTHKMTTYVCEVVEIPGARRASSWRREVVQQPVVSGKAV